MDDLIQENNTNKREKSIRRIVLICLSVCIIFLFFYFIFSSPKNSQDTIIHITPGQSLRDITLQLEKENVVRQSAVLQSFVIFLKSDRQIAKGDYLFNKGTPVWKVAWMLAMGKHNIIPFKITFPEGSTNEDMALILSKKIPNFDQQIFLEKIKNKQGYLFPDTYFFFPLTTIDEIISDLSSNFNHKINSLDKEIKSSKYTLKDIIIMASILEGEAKGEKDISIISGILWKRLEMGISLQVDADRWTYKNKGLPENPISNPGLSSIKASLNPTKTSYLYYLHDKTGLVHFAVNYTEHKRNIAKYLR